MPLSLTLTHTFHDMHARTHSLAHSSPLQPVAFATFRDRICAERAKDELQVSGSVGHANQHCCCACVYALYMKKNVGACCATSLYRPMRQTIAHTRTHTHTHTHTLHSTSHSRHARIHTHTHTHIRAGVSAGNGVHTNTHKPPTSAFILCPEA